MKRALHLLIVLIVMFVVLLVTMRAVGFLFPAGGSLLYHLLFGWLHYLFGTLPRVTIRWDGILTFIVGLVLLIATSHMLLRWLARQMTTDTESKLRQWQLRWTICGAAVVVLMFVAGIALVGIVHQGIWLATAPDDLFVRRIERGFTRRHSESNLKQIGIDVLNYHDVYHAMPNESEVKQHQSWITKVLPFAHGYQEEADFDKPWHADVNRPLFESVVPEFLNPDLPTDKTHTADGYGVSHYAGNEALFASEHPQSLADLPGGSSQTILAGEINADIAAWGEPGANLRPAVLATAGRRGFGGSPYAPTVVIVMADGRTRTVSKDIDPDVLRALGGTE